MDIADQARSKTSEVELVLQHFALGFENNLFDQLINFARQAFLCSMP